MRKIKYETVKCYVCSKIFERNVRNLYQAKRARKPVFCGLICAGIATAEYMYRDYINKWKCGEISGSRGEGVVSSHIRKYLFEKYNSKCCECGWAKVNPCTGKIPLEVEHIDGNSNNHKEENLKLLCPSCHSITPTYKSLNRGKGRKIRLEKLHSKMEDATEGR